MNRRGISRRNVTFDVEQFFCYNDNVNGALRKNVFIVLISNLWRLYETGASSACPIHETETASSLPLSPHVQELAPRVINTDKNAAYPKAIADLKATGVLPKSVELRQMRIPQQPY